MASSKTIAEKLAAWRRYRDAVRELSQLSDRELSDIGIRLGDIETIARQSATPRRELIDQVRADSQRSIRLGAAAPGPLRS